MRYLILSDIHANLEALEAVLEAAPPAEFDRVLVLGDLVGYGADPNGVVDRIRSLRPHVLIRGNHDKVASGVESPDGFNYLARLAAEWTRTALTEEHREFLRQLPAGPVVVGDRVEVCHGAPFDEDFYIFSGADALQGIEQARRPLCLFGHTHLPVVFVRVHGNLEALAAETDEGLLTIPLQPDGRYLVNPGSVGQPRDGDPRAAFAEVDDVRWELRLRRVDYPIEVAQRKIRECGLPGTLADRLELGR